MQGGYHRTGLTTVPGQSYLRECQHFGRTGETQYKSREDSRHELWSEVALKTWYFNNISNNSTVFCLSLSFKEKNQFISSEDRKCWMRIIMFMHCSKLSQTFMKGTPLLPLWTKDLPGLKSNNQKDIDASISSFNGGQKSLEQLLKTFLPHP